MRTNPRFARAIFTVAVSLAAGLTLRAQAPQPPGQKCPADVHADAVKAAAEARKKEDATAADPRRLPPGRSLGDYADVYNAAFDQAKIHSKLLKEAKMSVEVCRDDVASFKVSYPKLTAIDSDTESRTMNEARKERDRLILLKKEIESIAQKFNDNPEIDSARSRLYLKEAALKKVMEKFMPSDAQVKDVLKQINDTSFRDHNPQKVRAESEVNDPDEERRRELRNALRDDVVRKASQLLKHTSFGDAATQKKRRELELAIGASGGVFNQGGANPWADVRRLGGELIAEMDRCRLAVAAAHKPYSALEDEIKALRRKLDPAGAQLLEDSPDPESIGQSINKNVAEQEATGQRRSLGQLQEAVQFAEKNVKERTEAVVQSLTAAAKAKQDLDEKGAYVADLEAMTDARKAADALVATTRQAMDKDTRDMEAALARATADYAANETDLTAFRTQVNGKKTEIVAQANQERTTNARGNPSAAERMARLRTMVQTKKNSAMEKLEAIKTTLHAFRHCHKKAEDYITTLKQKIAALGGVATAGDLDGLGIDLLEVPVDKGTPVTKKPEPATGAVWVCEKPEIHVVGENPNVTRTASGFSIRQEYNGKQLSGKISWEGAKTQLREGETVTLTINASGDAYVVGWFNLREVGDCTVCDNNAASVKEAKRTGASPYAGKVEFKFKPGSNPYIQVSAGQDPGTARWVLVTWKYKKQQ